MVKGEAETPTVNDTENIEIIERDLDLDQDREKIQELGTLERMNQDTIN